MKNNLLIICCSVVGIAGGLIYNNATAYEMQVVTVSKQRMIKSECIDHSYKMATQWRAVECKSDPVKIKRQPNGRWSSKGVSLP